MGAGIAALALAALALVQLSHSLVFSSKLVHRFSEEARAVSVSRNGGVPVRWPKWRGMEFYRILSGSDLERQNMKLGARYQFLFPSEGSDTFAPGNDLGWLHYMWIDIGTPGVSFFVALDTGSDLFWVPCECIECAPLSARYYNLDRNLGVYSPTQSSTSKYLSCGHELCDRGSSCKSAKQSCPYTANYYSENTSTSGFLVQDILHFSSISSSAAIINTPAIIGCGRKQTGGYLSGIAPDGLMGLGFADISVPTFLSKMGFVRNAFSMCFDEDDSGRIFFGDQGSPSQQSTPFLTSKGKYTTYAVRVEGVCVATACMKDMSFLALVDTGSSFTFLPVDVYKKVTMEFDRHMNASRFSYGESTWDYCYKASALNLPKVPSVMLKFPGRNTFTVQNPIFLFYTEESELEGFCLALQPAESDIGTIGQNLMTGYHIVFDRENMKLGWSQSNCRDGHDTVPLTPAPRDKPENPLPTNQQQSSPGGHAVSPAVASRTPTDRSSAAPILCRRFCLYGVLVLTLAVSGVLFCLF